MMTNLQAAMKLAGSSGDDILDYVRFNLSMQRKNPDLAVEVTVSPLPHKLHRYMIDKTYMKACYQNTWECMKRLKSPDARYVLGYWHDIIPVEHCFLKVGDVYHDPTGEIIFPGDTYRYFSILELTMEQVEDCMSYMRRKYHSRDYISQYEWWRYECEVLGFPLEGGLAATTPSDPGCQASLDWL